MALGATQSIASKHGTQRYPCRLKHGQGVPHQPRTTSAPPPSLCASPSAPTPSGRSRSSSVGWSLASSPMPCPLHCRLRRRCLRPVVADGFAAPNSRRLPLARCLEGVAHLLPPFGQQEQIAGDLTLACTTPHGFMMIDRLSPCCLFRCYSFVLLLLSCLFAQVLKR